MNSSVRVVTESALLETPSEFVTTSWNTSSTPAVVIRRVVKVGDALRGYSSKESASKTWKLLSTAI